MPNTWSYLFQTSKIVIMERAGAVEAVTAVEGIIHTAAKHQLHLSQNKLSACQVCFL